MFMATMLDALSVSPGNAYLYSDGFLNFLESHLEFIKHQDVVHTILLDNSEAYRALGDCNMLQSILKLRREHWYINMRLNGFTHPNQLPLDHTQWYAIKDTVFSRMFNTYMTSEKRI